MKKLQNSVLILVCACIFGLSVLCTMPVVSVASAAERRTVVVGYFPFSGYHDYNADGERMGYGYEYLQEMSKYAYWQYEYHDCDVANDDSGYAAYNSGVYDSDELGSWNEAVYLLSLGSESGGIDLLTSASMYTDSDDFRAQNFDYAIDYPMGNKSTILTALSTNGSLVHNEFDTFDGIRVGMISGNSANRSLQEFSKGKFTYTEVYLSAEELDSALSIGRVDAIVTSSLRTLGNEKIIASFDNHPFYAMVKKGNTELLSELNFALAKVSTLRHNYEDILYRKYYAANASGAISYTAAEQAYIAGADTVTALLGPEAKPMSYYEGTELCGILPDIVRTVIDRAGLRVQFIVPKDIEEYNALKQSDGVDLICYAEANYAMAERNGYTLLTSCMTATYNMLFTTDSNAPEDSVALFATDDLVSNYVYANYTNVVCYPTVDECIQAVKKGKQRYTFVDSHVAIKYVNADPTDKLKYQPVSTLTQDMTMCVTSHADELLPQILEAAILSLTHSDMDKIEAEYSAYEAADVSLRNIVYRKPVLVVSLLLVFCATLLIVIIMVEKQRQSNQKRLLSEDAARLGSLLTNAFDDVIEVNFDTEQWFSISVIDGNMKFEQMHYALETRTSFVLNNLIHPADTDKYSHFFSREYLQSMAGSAHTDYMECRILQSDGTYHWRSILIAGIVADKQHPRNLVICTTDINKSKLDEEESKVLIRDALRHAEEASQSKSEFLSRMSHEIRTPLNAVINYMRLADKTEDLPKVKQYVKKTEYASQQLLSIVNEVLDLSAIESGKLTISPADFSLTEVFESLDSTFGAQAKEKGIDFSVISDKVRHRYLHADKLRINQILLNIISNAIKFTPSGGKVVLTVTELLERDSIAHLRFVVSDTGIGIAPEFLDKLFMPFEQQDASIGRRYGGTGLGMSITYNLVKMMNGAISVTSKLNEGSVFTVELPLQYVDESLGFDTANLQSIRLKNLLIIEDDIEQGRLAETLLEKFGFCVWLTANSDAAVSILREHASTNSAVDVVFANCADDTPAALVGALRAEDLQAIPVVLMSEGSISEDSFSEYSEVYTIRKPLMISEVADRLRVIQGDDQIECDLKGKRILLVEDNEMNKEIMCELLNVANVNVETADNGEIAVRKYLSNSAYYYDLILMDIQMPVMNGYDATHLIRASKHADCGTIPILAMTANAFAEDISNAFAAGMDGHVAKPIEPDSFFEQLRLLLNIK